MMAGTAVLVLDGTTPHDVFELVGIDGGVARVRSSLWFEIGEELAIRIEENGKTRDTAARVRAHTGSADARVTELELLEATT